MYLSALRIRILEDVEQQLYPLVGGVREGDLLAGWTARTATLVSKSLEWGIPLYILQLDIRRAFATIHHAFLLRACRSLGIREAWLCLLEHDLKSKDIQLNLFDVPIAEIPVRRGLIEGLPYTSLLIGIYLTGVMRTFMSTDAYSQNVFSLPADLGYDKVVVPPSG